MTAARHRTGGHPIGSAVKRLIDLALCVLSLPVTVPIGAVVAALVKATSRGPVLYRARRVGRHGRPIEVLKFRTMRVDCTGPSVTRSGDHRITPVGRFLRASKLDELPQIVNVLRGDMSIVGPRPEDPKYVASYTAGAAAGAVGAAGDHEPRVPSVRSRAGMDRTRSATDAESFYITEILPEKLAIELSYVREWSVRGDLRILARTLTGLLS